MNRCLEKLIVALLTWMVLSTHSVSHAATPDDDTSSGDRMLANYFRRETQKISDACLTDIKTWKDWTSRRDTYRQQLREMLGLDPMPERTPLGAVVTGTLQRDEFKVEKLYFQSRPHLYVTANLYLPKKITGRLPAILYVCGHSPAKKDGVSFGNKTKFQHHGAWFAQNGYVCLVIDTLQLGEIEGIHHGTYRENMWWWNARGYTPAGVETWNAMRAIDYLTSRPEVDPKKIGVTGRSGGGAYTWFVTALDDRVKAAVPVAGITDLQNHVVDGCVEHHCDCMYLVNTYRWDFPQVAALAAPRPLLILNTDSDPLFPLDGVTRLYTKARRIYDLAGKAKNISLQTAPGVHEDLPVLQRYALQWFNRHLKGENPPIETVAKDYFQPEELKVFHKLPADQINSTIHESFVPQAAAPAPPTSKDEWRSQRDKWMKELREKCFAGWPTDDARASNSLNVKQAFQAVADNLQFSAYDFDSQEGVRLRLYLLLPSDLPRSKLKGIGVRPVDEVGRSSFLSAMRVKFDDQLRTESLSPPNSKQFAIYQETQSGGPGLAVVATRGIGETKWNAQLSKQIHIRRRFALLGQTLDAMRVWDVRRALKSVHSIEGLGNVPVALTADREMSGIALYAGLFEPNIDALVLWDLPKSHYERPDFLNALRFCDVAQTVAMVADNSQISLHQENKAGWEYPLAVAKKLGWNNRIKIVVSPTSANRARQLGSR